MFIIYYLKIMQPLIIFNHHKKILDVISIILHHKSIVKF